MTHRNFTSGPRLVSPRCVRQSRRQVWRRRQLENLVALFSACVALTVVIAFLAWRFGWWGMR